MTKFVVCPACEGEGTVDNFGAFTSSDLDEWYGDSYERDEFIADYRAGRIGRASCDWCEGKRVVPAVDEYGQEADVAWQDHLEDLAIQRAEMRYAGGW
jgi:hypothetical protein